MILFILYIIYIYLILLFNMSGPSFIYSQHNILRKSATNMPEIYSIQVSWQKPI